MKLKIETNMNTALTTLNKTHEDPLKILQKCLQWIINKTIRGSYFTKTVLQRGKYSR